MANKHQVHTSYTHSSGEPQKGESEQTNYIDKPTPVFKPILYQLMRDSVFSLRFLVKLRPSPALIDATTTQQFIMFRCVEIQCSYLVDPPHPPFTKIMCWICYTLKVLIRGGCILMHVASTQIDSIGMGNCYNLGCAENIPS